MRVRLTLWRCARRAYIAPERFLLPETDALIFLVVRTYNSLHRAGEGSLVLFAAIFSCAWHTLTRTVDSGTTQYLAGRTEDPVSGLPIIQQETAGTALERHYSKFVVTVVAETTRLFAMLAVVSSNLGQPWAVFIPLAVTVNAAALPTHDPTFETIVDELFDPSDT